MALPAALNRGTALAAATPMQPFSPMHGLEPNKGLSTPKKRLSLLLSTKGTVAHSGGDAPRRPTIVPHHQYGLLRKVGLKKPIVLFLRPLFFSFSLIFIAYFAILFCKISVPISYTEVILATIFDLHKRMLKSITLPKKAKNISC